MDLPALLHTYGYALIFLGTLAEGETLLILGGYFAHQGYLNLGGVMFTAYIAAICGDQLFFRLGRYHAKRLLERFPRLREKVNVALGRVERHQIKVVLSMRFLWGLRIALPVALGLTRMSARRYLWLNLISAALWAVAFAFAGFAASELISRIVDDLHRYEAWIAGSLAFIGLMILGYRLLGARRPTG